MGTAMAPVTPVEKLYPPVQPEETKRILSALGGGERDRDGRLYLPRILTPVERAELQKRKNALFDKWCKSGAEFARIKAVVATMLLGFSTRAATAEEQNTINSQYAYTLSKLPAWAVERACLRFGSGDVRAADVGAKTLDLTWGPSSAQIGRVATSLYEPLYRELRAISDVLAGVPTPRTETNEEREKGKEAIAGMLSDAKSKMAGDQLLETEATARRSEASRERSRMQTDARRREYVDAGLPAPAGETFTSLPMMLHMGWRIEESPSGGSLLVAPHRRTASEHRGSTRDNEMGS